MKVTSYSTGRVPPGRFFTPVAQFPVTLVVVLASLVLSLFPGLSAWATWQEAAPIGPQVWLSHFTHWSQGHLFWDLLAFSILAVILERGNRRLLLRLLVCIPPIIISAIWLTGGFATYRGLSGLDCGLFAAAVILLWKQQGITPALPLTALGVLLAKSAYEILTGRTVFVSDLPQGIAAVPIAHMAGAAAGVLVSCLTCLKHPSSQSFAERKQNWV